MKDVHTAIFLRLGKREGSAQMSQLKNVTISNVTATCVSKVASAIVGVPGGIIDNVQIKDVEITLPGGGTVNDANANVPELVDAYPESNMFGTPFPAYGFYVRHANDVKFDNVRFNLTNADARPDYVFVDVTNHEVTDIAQVLEDKDIVITTDGGRLNISSYIEGNIEVDVFDISGKVVYTTQQVATGDVTIEVPERGVYLVSVRTAKGSVMRKVMCM